MHLPYKDLWGAVTGSALVASASVGRLGGIGLFKLNHSRVGTE